MPRGVHARPVFNQNVCAVGTEMRGRAETPQNYDWGLLIVWGSGVGIVGKRVPLVFKKRFS